MRDCPGKMNKERKRKTQMCNFHVRDWDNISFENKQSVVNALMKVTHIVAVC